MNEMEFAKHMKQHSKEAALADVSMRDEGCHKCPICPKAFAQQAYLRYHIRFLHVNERPFTCNYCEKTFKTKDARDLHARIHTGIKPFTCEICGASFRQMVHLTTHQRKHTGERPFVCPHCCMAFTTNGNLKKHVTAKHKNIS
jgi:KRAB domain-containing zinc finger protein